MRQLIRLYSFWYGCLGSIAALTWHISALLGFFSFPKNWWIVEGVFLLHGAAACFTFQSVKTKWLPIVTLTKARIWLGRALFGITSLNVCICIATFFVLNGRSDKSAAQAAIPEILTSILLQNTVYIAIHWAFRPENLFPQAFINALSNPFGTVLKIFKSN